MDFHHHQDKAKQSTARLIFFMTLAVLTISILVSIIITAALAGLNGGTIGLGNLARSGLYTTPLTALGIGATSLVKTSQIRNGGGAYVAFSMGGRRLDFNTLDAQEKQLTNIVEEIAIASAMPAPDIYVMDNEPGINAFAAGWTPENSVIGVTRGALDYLDRDELQGVIAHEFSHIYNGDTKIKTKLIGLVFGIVAIAFVGRIFLNQAFVGRRSSKGKNDGALAVLVIGLLLLVIGYAGSYFARLIQSAVSRQREYLADASAVQFTRDPDSLGRALSKIGALGNENKIVTPHVSETNHLFFTSALLSGMNSHPPLHKRIKRLIPDWDGTFEKPEPKRATSEQENPTNKTAEKALPNIFPEFNIPVLSGLAEQANIDTSPVIVAHYQAPTFSGPSQEHIRYAQKILNKIPVHIQNILNTKQGAMLSLLGLLVSTDETQRTEQLALLSSITKLRQSDLDQASKQVANLDRVLHLPAVDLGLRSFKHLPIQTKNIIIQAIQAIESSDSNPNLFQWVLRRVILRHIQNEQNNGKIVSAKQSLSQLSQDAKLILAAISTYSGQKIKQTQDAFDAALAAANLTPTPLPPANSITFKSIDLALKNLASLRRTDKQTFVMAAATATMHDGVILVEEAEFLRVLADAIGQPVPPLLPKID